MKYLRVSGTFILAGSVPNELKEGLVNAVRSVPQNVFFNKYGKPLKREVKKLDQKIASSLKNQGWTHGNPSLFPNSRFSVDLAFDDKKLLIEIEKGRQPRLELDIIKIASACHQFPEQWRFGALIVPSSYIELRLSGRQSPFEYLKRLAVVAQPVVARAVEGLLVVAYKDPRVQN